MYLGFKICQCSEYETVTQGSKYAATWLNTSELDENIPEDVWIYNNKQASEYVSYNTYLKVSLEVNEYILRDIQNCSKI